MKCRYFCLSARRGLAFISIMFARSISWLFLTTFTIQFHASHEAIASPCGVETHTGVVCAEEFEYGTRSLLDVSWPRRFLHREIDKLCFHNNI